jgi:hypothetical protein
MGIGNKNGPHSLVLFGLVEYALADTCYNVNAAGDRLYNGDRIFDSCFVRVFLLVFRKICKGILEKTPTTKGWKDDKK